MFYIIYVVIAYLLLYIRYTFLGKLLFLGLILFSFLKFMSGFFMECYYPWLLSGENLPKERSFSDLTEFPEYRKNRKGHILNTFLDVLLSILSFVYIGLYAFVFFRHQKILFFVIFTPMLLIFFRKAFLLFSLSLEKKPVFSVLAEVKSVTPGKMVQSTLYFEPFIGSSVVFVCDGVFFEVDYQGTIYHVFKSEDEEPEQIEVGDNVVLYSMDGDKVQVILGQGKEKEAL